MKQLRLLMAAFAAVFSLCANAQDWKGNTVADGTFYLYNIGSGQWLCGGNNWGTRASVNNTGDIDFQIAASGTGYTLDSQISNGGESHFLAPVDADAAYVDGGAYEWTFTQASRTDGVIAYIISCDHGNLFFSGEGTIVNIDTENGVGDNAQWVLVSLDDRMAKLQAASETNPVNATFLIKDAGFGRNDLRVSAWTMEANNQNLDGRGKPNNFNCAESWQSAFTLTQNVTVPNGKYQVTAQAALTDYTDAYDGADYPVVYANEASAPFKNMEGSDIRSNMETLSNSFLIGKYTVGPLEIAVVDGNITLGVRGTRTNTWCIWDNFQIFYLGEVQDFSAALQAAIDNVESFYGKLPAAVETEVKSFVDTQKASATNNEATQAAISALNAKANELTAIVKAFDNAKAYSYKSKYYDAVKAMADVKDYKEFAAGAHDKLVNALNGFAIPLVDINAVNALTTAEAINEYVANIDAEARNFDDILRAAGVEYINNAAPVGDAKFNITFMLTNANLDGLPAWNKCQGWESDRNVEESNNQVMYNTDRVASEDGTKTTFYEYWSKVPAADGLFTAYQKVELPVGKYDYSCFAYANPDNLAEATEANVKLYANDFEGPAITSTILTPYNFTFENAAAGEVKLGLKALEGNTFRWMGIGYVELFLNGITEEPIEPEPQGDIVDLIDRFTYTWNSEESLTHNDDKSITFNGVQWGGLAAWLADNDVPADWSNYEKLVFEFAEPTTVNVQGFVQTTTDNILYWGNPGITKLECPLEGKDVTKVNQVALQLSDPATIVITKIYLVKKSGEEPAPEFALTFDPKDGTEVAVDDQITLTFDEEAFLLYYTTDGSDPKAPTSNVISAWGNEEKVTVKGEGNFVINAYLENRKTDAQSEVFTATYPIKAVAPFALTFDPENGAEVAVDDIITMTFDGDAFRCMYTTDGSDPRTSMTVMEAMPNEFIVVKGEGEFVINAVLERYGSDEQSDIFTSTYTIKAAEQPVVKDLVLTDDDAEAPAPGEYETVTYSRKFFKGYNTIVLPFEYTNLELGADAVMKYEGTTKIGEEYHVQFTRMQDDQVLEANVPYVVFVQNDKKLGKFDNNKTVVAPDDLTVLGGDFDLVGSYKAYAKGESPVKKGDYIFRIDLQKAAGGNEHKAYRAYLKNNTGLGSANIYMMVDGELTGIYNIENDENANGYIYNLNGQRVNDSQKGILIINGKKVVRK